jgi:hypothetical protein
MLEREPDQERDRPGNGVGVSVAFALLPHADRSRLNLKRLCELGLRQP